MEHFFQWYSDEAEGKRHEAVWSALTGLGNANDDRTQLHLQNARLYNNIDLPAYYGSFTQPTNLPKNRLTYNICRSQVDTLLSKITDNEPAIMFLTEGGDWVSQQKAKDNNLFIDGIFYESKFYSTIERTFLNGSVFGKAFLKVWLDENNRIRMEDVLPLEITVDCFEALYNSPRTLYQKKLVSREVLKASWPKKSNDIEASKGKEDSTLTKF
ncbi:MAG: phage portal protein, partial [Parachlamydia sp.]|nr:phage portal protein [Parachlamydia sp.]